MKADLRISVKDYSRNKNLKIQLMRVPFAASRQFWVRMNGEPEMVMTPHPSSALRAPSPVPTGEGRTRLLTALRKALVRTT